MDERKTNQILLVTCASYLALGIMIASIGPLMSEFSTKNGISLAMMGGIYTAIFAGSLIAQLILGPVVDRWGQLRWLAISLILTTVMLAGITFSRWLPLTFTLAFFEGAGFGMSNLCGNVMIGKLFKEKNVAAVNWLNVAFGVGAFVGPLLVSLYFFLWKTGLPAIWTGAILMCFAVVILIRRHFNAPVGQTGSTAKPDKLNLSLFLWSLGAIVLLYVGTESAIGGWATTYLQGTTSMPLELASMVTAGYWLAITLGRLMGAILGKHLSGHKILFICLSIACVGSIFFILSYSNPVGSILAIFMLGFGIGAIYPTTMAVMTGTYGTKSGQAAAVLGAMGSIGGAVLPWLQGIVLAQFDMRTGGYLVAFFILLLTLSYLVNRRSKVLV